MMCGCYVYISKYYVFICIAKDLYWYKVTRQVATSVPAGLLKSRFKSQRAQGSGTMRRSVVGFRELSPNLAVGTSLLRVAL